MISRHWLRSLAAAAPRASAPPTVDAYVRALHALAPATRAPLTRSRSASLFVYFSRASFGPFCVSEAERRRKKGGADGSSDRRRYRGFIYKSFVRAFELWKCSFVKLLWKLLVVFVIFSYTVEVQRRQ